MTDGLATLIVVVVASLAIIAAGVAWWLNRPSNNAHDPTPRVQPLFGSDMTHAAEDATPHGVALRVASAPRSVGFAESSAGPHLSSAPSLTAPAAGDAAVQATRVGPDGRLAPRPVAAGDQAPRPQSFRTEFNTEPRLAPRVDQAVEARAAPVVPQTPGIDEPAGGRVVNAALLQPRLASRFAPPKIAPPGSLAAPSTAFVPEPVAALRTVRSTTPATVPPTAPETGPSTAPAPARAATPVRGDAVSFVIPTDGTLQFLAGRLEIVSGHDAGREIRFVRLPDTATPEITFGRNEGAPYRHVQLRDGTVSRLHARMRMKDATWTLTNLSTTNPVTYNGRTLGDGEEQPLSHDDRVEMGEVAFRFRNR